MIIMNGRLCFCYAINAAQVHTILDNMHSVTSQPLKEPWKTFVTGMAAKDHLPEKDKTWDEQKLVPKFKVLIGILHRMYGRGYKFLIHAKHQKRQQQ